MKFWQIMLDPNYTSPEQKRAQGQRTLNNGLSTLFILLGIGCMIFLSLAGCAILSNQFDKMVHEVKTTYEQVQVANCIEMRQGNWTLDNNIKACQKYVNNPGGVV